MKFAIEKTDLIKPLGHINSVVERKNAIAILSNLVIEAVGKEINFIATDMEIDIKEKRFCIEVEVLSKFLKTNSKIIEVPIAYEGRLYSEGKKIKFLDGISILSKIIYYSRLNIFNFR